MVEINQTPHIVGGAIQRNFGLGQVDIYYEKKLKEVFMIAADNPEGLLYDEQTWNLFVALVLKNRLASATDIDRLDKV